MTNDERRAIYLRNRSELTPAQSRRIRQRENQANSDRVAGGLSRYGRLRRRFDRKDQQQIQHRAQQFTSWVRTMKAAKNGSRDARWVLSEERRARS